MRLARISLSLRRPNEYTRWRPRIDHLHGLPFGAVIWGPVSLHWEFENPCQAESEIGLDQPVSVVAQGDSGTDGPRAGKAEK